MSDRLKQIWGGFERVTERSLTGRGVDNIAVPDRREFQGTDENFLPKDFSAPAEAAFAALRQSLTAEGKKARAREERRARTLGRNYSAPPAPLSADATEAGATEAGAPDAVRDLIRGLHSTEARTRRRDFDYTAFAASNPKAAPRLVARKKFLGIF